MRLNKLVYLYGDKEKHWIIDNYDGRIGEPDEDLFIALKNNNFKAIPIDILEELGNLKVIVEDEFKHYVKKF